MGMVATPYGYGYTGLMQLLIAWREWAWRAAEQLIAAPDEAARAEVAAMIERKAMLEAEAIVAATSYQPPVRSTDDRDRYCASQSGGGSATGRSARTSRTSCCVRRCALRWT
jgi:hypothetical protein